MTGPKTNDGNTSLVFAQMFLLKMAKLKEYVPQFFYIHT